MDFYLPETTEEFRREVRGFLAKEWPDELEKRFARHVDEMYDVEREFRHKLGKQGWLALSWPKDYGGQERDPLDYYVFHEEMAYHGAPAANVATRMVAPTLMLFGNEEQRQRFLPRIAAGDVEFCLGYSEPDAGTDLASLQARAQEDGDFYVVNGIKRWTTYAHRSEYCWLAARTDPDAPKHKGISLFIVDMQSPGITIKPIRTMGHRVNELYLEDVRIPRENLVGEANRGWYYIAAALDFERVAGFAVGRYRAKFDRLVNAVRSSRFDGRALKDDPLIRQKIGQLSVELEATQLLSYRAAWLVTKGVVPNTEAAILKTLNSEAQQRMSHVAMLIFGLYSQLREEAPDSLLDGDLERDYREMVMPTFGAGANEVMRDIVATRGLGLPRD